MDDKTKKKIETMNSVLVKMADIQNSQQSLIEKIARVEVDLFNINSKDLDAKLEQVMDHSNDSMDIIKEAIEAFEIKRNGIRNEA
ncbi:MAG: hypothetical protein KDD32_07970 [Bacteroidetes bacterium]|nr:hypothetical protein [Bacteroidota bacterium]